MNTKSLALACTLLGEATRDLSDTTDALEQALAKIKALELERDKMAQEWQTSLTAERSKNAELQAQLNGDGFGRKGRKVSKPSSQPKGPNGTKPSSLPSAT